MRVRDDLKDNVADYDQPVSERNGNDHPHVKTRTVYNRSARRYLNRLSWSEKWYTPIRTCLLSGRTATTALRPFHNATQCDPIRRYTDLEILSALTLASCGAVKVELGTSRF